MYTIQEIEAVKAEWEERMNDMDSGALQVFANNLERALIIAKRDDCKISSNPNSLIYSPIHAIVTKAREMASKRGYK